jgi:hypothetical protein
MIRKLPVDTYQVGPASTATELSTDEGSGICASVLQSTAACVTYQTSHAAGDSDPAAAMLSPAGS